MAITWQALGAIGGSGNAVLLTTGPRTLTNAAALTSASARVAGLTAAKLPSWLTIDESAGYSRLVLSPGKYMTFGAIDAKATYSDEASATSFGFMLDSTFFHHRYDSANAYEDHGAKMFGLGVGFRAPVSRSLSMYAGIATAAFRDVKNIGVMVSRVADEPLAGKPAWATGPAQVFYDFENELSGNAIELGLVDKAYSTGVFSNLGEGLEYNAGEREMGVYHTPGDVGGLTEQWADVELGIPPVATSFAGVALRATATTAIVCAVNATSWRVFNGTTDQAAAGTTLATGSLATTPKAGDRIGGKITGGASPSARVYVNGVDVGGGPITPTVATGLLAGVELSNVKGIAGTLKNFRAGGIA